MTFPNTTFISRVTTVTTQWFQAVNDYIVGLGSSAGSSLVGFLQGGAGAQPRTVENKLRDVVSVKDFGAVGDGVADDTNAIVAADTYCAANGFDLYFPRGTYRTTAVIDKQAGVTWRGTGRRKAYPGIFTPGVNTLSTIYPTHTGRCAVRVYSLVLDSKSGTMFRDINFATAGAAGSAGPEAAFGFECGEFHRDFTFERVGIHGFTSALDVYKPSGIPQQMGVLKVINCAISLNKWIARTLDGTQWNGFVFRDNEAGQNGWAPGTGGINIAAHAVVIEGNLLEGQRDPVRVYGAFKGLSIRGNYFEVNPGKACIELKAIRGPWVVGPNTYLAVDYTQTDHLVLLGTPCGPGHCHDPYWPELVHKTALPVLGADTVTGDNTLNPNANYPFARVDMVIERNWSQPPMSINRVTQAVTVGARETNPQTGQPMPAQQYTTAGAGAVALTYSIAGSSGQWVVVSWLVRQIPDASATADPYISLNINGTGAAGSRDYVIENVSQYWRQGEWMLITVATKIGAAGMTSLGVTLFPHGTTPAAGRVSNFLRPVVYTVDVPDKIVPFVNNQVAQSISAAPGAGTWIQGDLLTNSGPGGVNQAFLSCIVSGTPGTWVLS